MPTARTVKYRDSRGTASAGFSRAESIPQRHFPLHSDARLRLETRRLQRAKTTRWCEGVAARLKLCPDTSRRQEHAGSTSLFVTWPKKGHPRLVKSTASLGSKGQDSGATTSLKGSPLFEETNDRRSYLVPSVVPSLFFAVGESARFHHDMCAPNWKRRMGKPGCKLVITGPALVSTCVPIHVAFWGIPKLVRLKTLKLSKRS